MNSFTLTAIGNLARNPELIAKGDTLYTRFCLVGNDYAGKDEDGATREIVTAVWFVAFGTLGEKLVRDARKGDQIIVEARMRSNNWTDKQGEKQYDHSYIVQGYRFGAPGKAKREERGARRENGQHEGYGSVTDGEEAEGSPNSTGLNTAEADGSIGNINGDPSGESAPGPVAAKPSATSASRSNARDKPATGRGGRKAASSSP